MKNMKIILITAFFCTFGMISCQELEGSTQPLSFLTQSYVNRIVDQVPVFCSENTHFYGNKILFVVDRTKTNQESDPEGMERLNGIKNFIRNNRNKDAHFGFIVFSEKITSPMTIQGIPVFRSRYIELERALQDLSTYPDEGEKQYSELFEWIQKTIENDMRTSAQKINEYNIIFLSDGYPSVDEEEQNQFTKKIRTLTHTYNNVYVHAGYYGQYKNRSPGMGENIKKFSLTALKTAFVIKTGIFLPMAFLSWNHNESAEKSSTTDDVEFVKDLSSGGDFVDYNQGEKWKFADKMDKTWNMKFFLVYNLNAGFCFDGLVGVDSDGDGLCDRDEEPLEGFNVHSRFSFNDGYGDYFHLIALKDQNMLPPCVDRKDEDRDLLTSCEEKYLNKVFQESGSGRLSLSNPDSDGDGLIDGLEAMVYLIDEIEAPVDPSNLKQTRDDNETDMAKIRKHISPFAPSKGQRAYDTVLSPIRGAHSSCYGIRQNTLPVYPTVHVQKEDTLKNMHHKKDENVILIYSIQQMKGAKDAVYQFTYLKAPVQKNNDSGYQKRLKISLTDNQFDYFVFNLK